MQIGSPYRRLAITARGSKDSRDPSGERRPGMRREIDDDDITQEMTLTPGDLPRPKKHGTLHVLSGPDPGLVISIPHEGETVLGRGRDADCRMGDRGLSRRHARFFGQAGAFFVEDLGSTNGVRVEGERLGGAPRRLRYGDRITMGEDVTLVFQRHDDLSKQASERLYEYAVRDPLTGLYNRRYLDERLAQELAFAVRHGVPVSVLLIDLDHFKSVNDTYGHAAGDAVLLAVARVLDEAVRTEDVVARFGGEEVCVVIRGIDDRGALALSERLRKNIESLPVNVQGQILRVTASFGVATFRRQSDGDVLQRADQALYAAKARGRNRCFHVDHIESTKGL